MLHWDESETESSNWIGKIWNILLAGIILVYIVSLINSKVKTYCNFQDQKKVK